MKIIVPRVSPRLLPRWAILVIALMLVGLLMKEEGGDLVYLYAGF